jgi:uncharacterized protein (DUF3084 family)
MSILAGIAIATVTTIGLPFASQAFAEPSDTEIQTAQTQFDDAQRNFDVMKTERDNSNAQLHKTRQQAEDVKNKAKKASEIADEATRAYIRMLRDGSPVATLKLNDIQNDTTGMLNDFGIMGNDSAVTTNVRIGDQITQFRATSAALKQQLTEVENAVNTFPTEARNQDVANAENEVNLKRNHLEFLKNQRQPKADHRRLGETSHRWRDRQLRTTSGSPRSRSKSHPPRYRLRSIVWVTHCCSGERHGCRGWA